MGMPVAARLFHHTCKASSQFADPVLLAEVNGLVRDQIAADPQRNGAGPDEIGSGLLIHTARRNEWNVRERPSQCPNISRTAHLGARKNLHEIRPSLPRRHDLRGCKRAREDHHAALDSEFHCLQIESGAGEELSSSIHATARGIYIGHGAASGNHIGIAAHQFVDDFDGARDSHRDFNDRYAAPANGFGRENGVFRRSHPDGRNNSDFLDPRANLVPIHGYVTVARSTRGPQLKTRH